MTAVYHILGSDIPHHNRTLLDFFRRELLPELHGQSHFFYVVGEPALTAEFADLTLTVFRSPYALAQALMAKKRQNPTACFILHGQFNRWIWLAIVLGGLSADNLIWHIWGADLYRQRRSLAHRLFYHFRRLAQRKIRQVWATRGDLDYLWRNVRARSAQDRLIYFPTKLPCGKAVPVPEKLPKERFTILLGNSGDRSNRHLAALTQIRQKLGENVEIIVPMGYPKHNERYIRQLEQHYKRSFFSKNLQILREKQDFDDYQALLSRCDLGYFNFERQQGIGTICLLIRHNIPCVLHPNNPFCLDMQAENIPFLTAETLNQTEIERTKQQLAAIDKNRIGFFYPAYLKLWRQRLMELTT